MKHRLILAILALVTPATFVPSASAAETTLSYGATLTSEYVSSGIRYSDGPALQPYVELGFDGLYAGAYTTNVDADLTSADVETGLSLGYRGDVGSLSYDLSLNYYIYTNAFPNTPVEDSAEAIASGIYAVSDTVYVTAKAGLAPEYDQTNLSLTVDYYTALEGLAIGVTFGRLDANYGAWNYWSVGATYQVSDTIGLGLAYHDSNVDPAVGLSNTDGLFVGSVSFDF